MVAYGIGVLLLIKRVKAADHDVINPWYADDAKALGKFNNLERDFNSLKHNSPSWGYYPEPTKMILILYPENIEAGNFLAHIMGLQFSREHIILVVISGVINPKAFGSKRELRTGKKHSCSNQNGGEIFSGELCRGGPCDQIGVHLFATLDKRYQTGV